jgi:hypothetical protein
VLWLWSNHSPDSGRFIAARLTKPRRGRNPAALGHAAQNPSMQQGRVLMFQTEMRRPIHFNDIGGTSNKTRTADR